MKNKVINKARIEFPSYSSNESAARAMAASFIAQLDPTYTELSDIKCAVSEAVTNCTVHAYRGTVGTVRMDIVLFENRTVRIAVKDSGCGISDVKLAMEPLFTTDPENERSGMGFAVMQSFTDSLKVSSKVGHGTKVVMTKALMPLAVPSKL